MKLTMLHMRSEEPKELKLGRKLESVKESGTVVELVVVEVLEGGRVNARPSSGQALPQYDIFVKVGWGTEAERESPTALATEGNRREVVRRIAKVVRAASHLL